MYTIVGEENKRKSINNEEVTIKILCELQRNNLCGVVQTRLRVFRENE